jgi:hypothetical protein
MKKYTWQRAALLKNRSQLEKQINNDTLKVGDIPPYV